MSTVHTWAGGVLRCPVVHQSFRWSYRRQPTTNTQHNDWVQVTMRKKD